MSYPHHPMLDRRIERTGVYSVPLDETSWSLPVADRTLNTVILSDSFGDSAGDEIAIASNNGTTAKVSGDYSAGPVLIGRSYTMRAKLGRPYARDANGKAITDGQLQLAGEAVACVHSDTMAYSIKAVLAGTTDRTATFSSATAASGDFASWLNGPAEDMDIYIINSTAKPCTINRVRFIGDLTRRHY